MPLSNDGNKAHNSALLGAGSRELGVSRRHLLATGNWRLATNSGGVAQMGEHLFCKQGVMGSIPITSTLLVARSEEQLLVGRGETDDFYTMELNVLIASTSNY